MSTRAAPVIDFQPDDQQDQAFGAPKKKQQPQILPEKNNAQAPKIDFQEETPSAAADSVTSQSSPEEGPLGKAAHAYLNYGKGIWKGAGNTIGGISSLINKIPVVGETLAPREGIDAFHELTRPEGTAQNVGYYGEQVGETLIPGLGEEGAGEKALTLAPKLGKLAPAIGRIGYNALTLGALNKLQGGEFGSGAALGAGGSLLGEAGKAVAPSLAETALGISKKYRGFGKTPGIAVLEETGNAVRPESVAQKARQESQKLTGELEKRAKVASLVVLTGKAAPASTQPALDLIDEEMQKAGEQGAENYYTELGKLRNQLTNDFRTGNTRGTQMTPSQILNLKRGVSKLEKSWSPETAGVMRGMVRKVYGALDSEVDRTVPGAQQLNQRISSLIPVAERAESIDRGAGMTQRVAHRLQAHTGALTSAAAGGILGYREGGIRDALMGGTAGLLGPELIASPTAEMTAAKVLRSPRTLRLVRGIGSQALGRGSIKNVP